MPENIKKRKVGFKIIQKSSENKFHNFLNGTSEFLQYIFSMYVSLNVYMD